MSGALRGKRGERFFHLPHDTWRQYKGHSLHHTIFVVRNAVTLLAAHPQSASHIKRNSFFVPLGILVATGPAEAQFLGVCTIQDFARLVKLGENGHDIKIAREGRMRCMAYLVVANRSHMLIYAIKCGKQSQGLGFRAGATSHKSGNSCRTCPECDAPLCKLCGRPRKEDDRQRHYQQAKSQQAGS